MVGILHTRYISGFSGEEGKLIIVGWVAMVFVLANIRPVVNWLDQTGLPALARFLRREYLAPTVSRELPLPAESFRGRVCAGQRQGPRRLGRNGMGDHHGL